MTRITFDLRLPKPFSIGARLKPNNLHQISHTVDTCAHLSPNPHSPGYPLVHFVSRRACDCRLWLLANLQHEQRRQLQRLLSHGRLRERWLRGLHLRLPGLRAREGDWRTEYIPQLLGDNGDLHDRADSFDTAFRGAVRRWMGVWQTPQECVLRVSPE